MIQLAAGQIRRYASPMVRKCMGDDVGDRFDEAFYECEGEDTDLYGLFAGDELIAVAGLGHEISKKKVWLGYFAIAKEYRRSGYGTDALTFIEEAARERGYEWMFVETYASPIFEPAIQFYEKRGYRQVGELPEFLDDGSDAIYFRKALA